jgi:hypothetical protein
VLQGRIQLRSMSGRKRTVRGKAVVGEDSVISWKAVYKESIIWPVVNPSYSTKCSFKHPFEHAFFNIFSNAPWFARLSCSEVVFRGSFTRSLVRSLVRITGLREDVDPQSWFGFRSCESCVIGARDSLRVSQTVEVLGVEVSSWLLLRELTIDRDRGTV